MSSSASTPTFEGKTIVFLRTSSVARIPVYEQLREKGLRMIVVHPFVNKAFSHIFHHWIAHDTNDVASVDGVICELLEREGLKADAIVSFDEYGVYPAACLAVRHGLRPVPFSPEKVQRTSIKSDFREMCADIGINSPAAVAIRSSSANYEALLSEMSFPVVIKPSPGAGSLLAKLCGSMSELKAHAAMMWHVLKNHPDVKHFRAIGTEVHLLVEEYIGGQEVDIDCAIVDGVVKFAAISDNFEVEPPYFVERGGTCPSRLPADEQAALRDLLDRYVAAMGSEMSGVLHFEAKYDHDREKAYIIEVNCRLGSAETNTMVTTAYGVPLGECLVRSALGMSIDDLVDAAELKTHCASVNLYPCCEGVLAEVSAPASDKDMVRYSISAEPGATVAPPPKAFFLLAWMVARGGDHDEAVANINRLSANFVQVVDTPQ